MQTERKDHGRAEPIEVPARPFTLNAAEIDWRLLRKQKRRLNGMLLPIGKLPANLQEAVSGIVNLLDYVQDEAATALGEKAVFGRTP